MSESYIKILWTCGMGDNCTNTTRPGTHEEYAGAGVCLAASHLPSQSPDMPSAA